MALIFKRGTQCFVRNCCIRALASSVVPPPRAPFGKLEDADLSKFESILGKKNVQTDDLDPYNTDFLRAYKGASKCALFPSSYEEVSQILRHCYSRKLAVVPQSGNTGLVGGSVPVYDEIILSLKKLNKRFNFMPDSGVLDCDAGFILEEVDNRLAADGYMMPWDLGSRGSCLLGGNVSTCVGGVRRLRFGSVHSHIVGLDVVLADQNGTIVNFGSILKKDNTGLHTQQLFVGAEGQLGVIVGVKLSVAPRPSTAQVMMLGAKDTTNCLKILRLAKQSLCEILSAVELMDSECMRCLLENKQLKSVLTSNPPYTLLIETMGSSEAHDKEKVEKFLATALEQGICSDGVQAASAQEAAYMWKLRKTLPVAPMVDGYVYKHDISLPFEHFFALSDMVRQRLGSLAKRVCVFGHMAEGDSHVNVSAEAYSPELTAKLYPHIWEWVSEHGGSVSAEHGIGQEHRPYRKLGKGYDVDVAKQLKAVFDPRGILSPYKMI